MRPGRYRNELGVIITVVGPFKLSGVNNIGSVYEAYREDELFGRISLLVTEQGMEDARYRLIEEAK